MSKKQLARKTELMSSALAILPRWKVLQIIGVLDEYDRMKRQVGRDEMQRDLQAFANMQSQISNLK